VRTRNRRHTLGRTATTLTGVVLLAVTAACSTGESEASSATGGAGSSTASKEFDAKVDDTVAKAKGEQTTPPPTDGPTAVPGQKVAFVTITEAEPAALAVLNSMKEATKQLGWEETTYNANGSATDANKYLQQAVTTSPDAIVVLGLDNTATGAGLAAAKAAGIPVACMACWPEGQPDSLGPYVSVQPNPDTFAQMGYIDAAYAYQKTGGHPHFLTFNDPTLSNLTARQQGFDKFIDECKAAGGDCSVVKNSDFQVANVTTTLAAQAASVGQANRDFNVVWASFDFAGQYVVTGLRQAGLVNDKSFLVSANGDPSAVQIIKDKGYQAATIGQSEEWIGWAVMDDLNRVLAGKPVADQHVPNRLFDATNIDKADDWQGDVDFRAMYSKVWAGS
jgi:ribose transport system substrate-binding protein